MPLPKTTSVQKVMSFLKEEKPEMSKKQRIAIALKQTGKSKYSNTAVALARKLHGKK